MLVVSTFGGANFRESGMSVSFCPIRLAVKAEIDDWPARGVMVEYFTLSKMMSALPRIAPDARIFQIGSLMPKDGVIGRQLVDS